MEQRIIDRLIKRAKKLEWQHCNGADGPVYIAYFEIGGNLFMVTLRYEQGIQNNTITPALHVLREVYDYKVIVHNPEERGNYSGPLVFETKYRAEEFFKIIDEKIKVDWAKKYPPQKSKEEMTRDESISFLAKNL